MANGSGPQPSYREPWPNAPRRPAVDPDLTDGVLGRRLLGYLVDFVVLAVLVGILWLVIAILGVVTFGAAWLLFPLLPLTAIAYNAVTIGGPAQATIGMRVAGVRVVEAGTGGRVSMLVAAVHALLFYVAVTSFLLWLVDVLFGMGRADGRMGHDLLTGVIVVRTR